MAADPLEEPVRYRFGPLERRGLIAGWRGGQIVSVAAGLVVAIAVLRTRPSALSIAAALGSVGVGLSASWWPIGGRTAEEWLPVVTRWAASGLVRRPRRHGRRGSGAPGGGRHRRAGIVSQGFCVGPDGKPCPFTGAPVPSHLWGGRGPGHGLARAGGVPAGTRSGPYAGLRLIEFDAPGEGAPVGVVHDPRARTYTAAIEVLGHSFALVGGKEKERRVASWSAVLGSLSRERSVVHRLQWLATTIPDGGAAVGRHLASRAVLPQSAPARSSYEGLLVRAGAATCRHEVLLAVQVRAAGSTARLVRSAGGGDRGACALVAREVGSLRRQLASADVPVERVLDLRALASTIQRSGAAHPAAARPCPPCAVGWPWPISTEAHWSCVRTDGTWHATYWIAEWPRVEVGPEFLGPLLLGSLRLTVAVVMEPLSPSGAVRRAERARTADIADAELRRRGGFLTTARRAREADLAVRREEELADGHASFRFSGYVTVTAPTSEQLAAACDATEQAASQCRLELRRLYGDQEQAFGCSLPLGWGLA